MMENTNLLPRDRGDSQHYDNTIFDKTLISEPSRTEKDTVSEGEGSVTHLTRVITLPYAIGIMVSSMVGAGIFVTPNTVANYAGSTGLTLILWFIIGLLVLLLSLCYADLGSAMPMAGGEYHYIHEVSYDRIDTVPLYSQNRIANRLKQDFK